jgi:hypothetical protein
VARNPADHAPMRARSARFQGVAGSVDQEPRRYPRISVVIASRDAGPELERLLAAVGESCRDADAEVVVAVAGGAEPAALRAAHPGARVVFGGPDEPVGALRGRGMREASGDLVALADDLAPPRPDWLDPLIRAQRAFRGLGMDHSPRLLAANPAPGLAPNPSDTVHDHG